MSDCLQGGFPAARICDIVDVVTKCVYFGVIIDCFIKWDQQIKQVFVQLSRLYK